MNKYRHPPIFTVDEEKTEPFQSETTLIESNTASQNEFQSLPSSFNFQQFQAVPAQKEDIFSSIKARIVKFFEKPIEKLYGKVSTSNAIAIKETLEDKERLKVDQHVKKLIKSQAQPTQQRKDTLQISELPATQHNSSSLLSRISTKLHNLKPFHEFGTGKASVDESGTSLKTAKSSTRLTKKSAGSVSVEGGADEGHVNEIEYLRALKARKLFESRYKVSFTSFLYKLSLLNCESECNPFPKI